MAIKSRSRTLASRYYLVSEVHWATDASGHYSSSTHTSGPWGPYADTASEVIEYGVGKQHANDCEHSKIEIKYNYLPPFKLTIVTTPPATAGENHNQVVWVTDPVFPSADQVPVPGFNMFQFYLRAYQHCKPKFRAPGQLVNDLLELRDLARIVPHGDDLKDIMNALRALGLFGGRGESFLSALKRVSKAVSGQYLNLEFGILTMIQSISDFASSVIEFNSKLDAFLRGAGKTEKWHYRERFSSNEKAEHTLGSFLLWREFTRTTFPGLQEYHATIIGSYTIGLKKIDVPKVFRKYIGFRSDPRIIWNAIPFSFVVDWFLGISNALESFDPGAIPVTFTIDQMIVSRKYTTQIDWVASRNPPSGSVLTNDFPDSASYCRYTNKRYSRYLLEHETLSRLQALAPLPTWDNLSLHELILGGALASQRLR